MMVSVDGLSLTINGELVLDNLDLQVKKGSFFGLFGPDDAGKTSLLNVLCGFKRQDCGTVQLGGKAPGRPGGQEGACFRLAPDDIIWEELLTGQEYLNFCRHNSSAWQETVERKLCEQFGIPANRRLLDMTYGENKMVQIIGALSAMPDLLILDEPKNFLDKVRYRSLLDTLETFSRHGMTVLLAAEAYRDVESYCTHYAYMKEGRIAVASEVPRPDYRKKMVIVDAVSETFVKAMERLVAERRGRYFYLYHGPGRRLGELLAQSGCEDAAVEELTLEEELEQDYSRWE